MPRFARRLRTLFNVGCALTSAAAPLLAFAAKPHQHGVVQLDAALEGRTLTLQMQAPLDSLLGFERRPRTDAERKAAGEVLRQLKDPAALLKPAAAAACSAGATQLDASVLAPAGAADKPRQHAELEVTWTFTCASADKLDSIEIGLFDAFRRIERIEVQVAGPKGQSRQTLTRAKRRLPL